MAANKKQPLTIEEFELTPEEDLPVINPYTAAAAHGVDAGDWMKGLTVWPWPDVDNADDLRAKLLDNGDTIEGFKKGLLYSRWIDRLPWMADL